MDVLAFYPLDVKSNIKNEFKSIVSFMEKVIKDNTLETEEILAFMMENTLELHLQTLELVFKDLFYFRC